MKNMKYIALFLLSILMTGATTPVKAANPILPLWEFIPDGEPYVFEDPDNPGKYRVYLYGSHDILRDNYCGRDQVVWSAPVEDLNNWRFDGVIFRSIYDGNGKQLDSKGLADVLYAPDVTYTTDANGKKTYYLYPNNQAWGRNGQVAKSDRPDGPFIACNWDKQDPRKSDGVLAFDPAVFVDDDGRVYGYWGFEKSNGAELDPKTMATVKPGTKIVEDMIPNYKQPGVERFFEASSMRKIKDKYVFIYSRWTQDGEFGLPETNYTLAYCYSNNPLGPFKYGGTIIDGRGKEPIGGGKYRVTACPSGNTHGSICEINGKWFVFYHRQSGNDEYSRQAMVAPITVEVTEGPNGTVKISEGEYTSEGFELDGLNPLKRYPAGIACYYTGPEPAHQEYPYVIYPGPYNEAHYADHYGDKDPYDAKINVSSVLHNTSGSVVGYKYFNFDKTYGKAGLKLSLNYVPEGLNGRMDIYVDRPSLKGGKKIGTLNISATKKNAVCEASIPVEALKQVKGKHALFFVFSSAVKGHSICQLKDFQFVN